MIAYASRTGTPARGVLRHSVATALKAYRQVAADDMVAAVKKVGMGVVPAGEILAACPMDALWRSDGE